MRTEHHLFHVIGITPTFRAKACGIVLLFIGGTFGVILTLYELEQMFLSCILLLLI